MKSKLPTERPVVNDVDETEKTTRFKLVPPPQDSEQTTVIPIVDVSVPANSAVAQPEPIQAPDPAEALEPVEHFDGWKPAAEFAPPEPEAVEPEAASRLEEPVSSAPRHAVDPDDTEVLEELATLLQEMAPLAEPSAEASPPVTAEPAAAKAPAGMPCPTAKTPNRLVSCR